MNIENLKNKKLFLKNFIANPKNIGSITPSSKKLCKKITNKISNKNNKIIIEIGPGTGVITEEILLKMNNTDKLFLFELNNEFYEILSKIYKDYENVIVINENANNIIKVLKHYNINKVDNIISGIPFVSINKLTAFKIILNCKKILKEDGNFSLFQYSPFFLKYFKKYFNIEKSFVLNNIPSAFVYYLKLN